MAETAELPLFPLGTVLFPNQTLPLHIFEDRYKLMIGECLKGDMTFGVVLIKQGTEVGAPAVPFEVGTTARIVGMQPIGDGRMQVQSLGQRPFKIVQLQQTHPYLKAIIEYLDHDRGDADRLRSLAEAVKEQFLNHLDILAKLMDRQRPEFELDLDPERLSYIVAGSMAVDMPEKQRLLEITAAEERLKTEAAILARENRALQTFMYLRDQQQKGPQGPQDQGPWGRIYTN